MADTLVLEASAARRGGSSPSGSTKCSCGGMADTLVLGTSAFGHESSTLSSATKLFDNAPDAEVDEAADCNPALSEFESRPVHPGQR